MSILVGFLSIPARMLWNSSAGISGGMESIVLHTVVDECSTVHGFRCCVNNVLLPCLVATAPYMVRQAARVALLPKTKQCTSCLSSNTVDPSLYHEDFSWLPAGHFIDIVC